VNPQQSILRGVFRTYQLTLRPIIGCNCRFYPHCSDYGMEAVATHGALKGAWLTGRRILRCNPWHPGGYDPVPLPSAAPAAHAGPVAVEGQFGTKGSPLP
jgi:putative membrane protein insertion efficiency factor